MRKPCLDCGEVSEGSRCEECAAQFEQVTRRISRRGEDATRDRLSPRERGYDTEWRKLSARARRLQPFCSDCFAIEDLTADHLPSAWVRKAQGKPLRLRDVVVLCRECNSGKGSTRPGSERAA